jgi:hypothetical protein
MKYIIYNKIEKKYFREPSQGLTDYVHQAHEYTEDECLSRIAHSNDLDKIPVGEINSFESSPAFCPKLASTLFNFLGEGSTVNINCGVLYITLSSSVVIHILLTYGNPLMNIWKDGGIRFSISLNSFDYKNLDSKAGCLWYENTMICKL